MRRSPRRGRVLVVLGVVTLLVLVLGAAMEGTLVYARSPAEVTRASTDGSVRVSGVVVNGSLRVSEAGTSFELEGGGGRLAVSAHQTPPGTFQEGQQAVVEGHLGADGIFIADRVIAEHGNTYAAPIDKGP